MTSTLRGLLEGPQAIVEHSAANDGWFVYLCGPLPVAVLATFSTTFQRQVTELNRAAEPRQSQYMHLRVSGGDAYAHMAVLNWLMMCCDINRIVPISESIPWSARFVHVLTCMRLLDMANFEQELTNAVQRLYEEGLPANEACQLFASSVHTMLPETQNAVIGGIARLFSIGRLPDLEQYFNLAKANQALDCRVLDALRLLQPQREHGQRLDDLWIKKDVAECVRLFGPESGQWLQQASIHARPETHANLFHALNTWRLAGMDRTPQSLSPALRPTIRSSPLVPVPPFPPARQDGRISLSPLPPDCFEPTGQSDAPETRLSQSQSREHVRGMSGPTGSSKSESFTKASKK